jgi:hypothetical protein
MGRVVLLEQGGHRDHQERVIGQSRHKLCGQ